jgi:hypothetical protein
MLMSVEAEWYFCTLSVLALHIGSNWAVLMRVDDQDPEDILWYVIPCDERPADEMEDLSEAAEHPDRVTIKLRDGILFSHATRTPRSVWMNVQLKEQPELAGRII